MAKTDEKIFNDVKAFARAAIPGALDQKMKKSDWYLILADAARRSASAHDIPMDDYEAERLSRYIGQFWWKREQDIRADARRQRKAQRAVKKQKRSGKPQKGSSWGWKKHIEQSHVTDNSARWQHFRSIIEEPS